MMLNNEQFAGLDKYEKLTSEELSNIYGGHSVAITALGAVGGAATIYGGLAYGAATGAEMGVWAGPWGMAAGAGIGALLGGFSAWALS